MRIVENTDPILNPSFVFGSFEWTEPVTTLTSLIVAVVAFYAFVRLPRSAQASNVTYRLYRMYFLFFGIGMLSAAFLGHALQAYLGMSGKVPGWILSTAANMFLVLASISQLSYKWTSKLIKALNALFILKFFAFTILILVSAKTSFRVVQINTAIDIVCAVLPLQFIFWRSRRLAGSLYIIIAILCSPIPGVISFYQLSISKWFNYHDIGHMFMAAFAYVMFLGSASILEARSIGV